MKTYTGSRGGVHHGNAPPEDCEAMERWNARCELGAEMRAARERRGLGLREFARAVGLSHATVSRAERGDEVLGAASVARVAEALGANADRWLALSGHVEPGLLAALLAQPKAWDDVRALLAGRRK